MNLYCVFKVTKHITDIDHLGLGVEHAHLQLITVMAVDLAEVNETGLYA